jgi:hypothetical protein
VVCTHLARLGSARPAGVAVEKQGRWLCPDGRVRLQVGQALSARPDLLPKPYLEALAQLQDQLPPFDTPTALALIQEDLGRPVSRMWRSVCFCLEAKAALSLRSACECSSVMLF